MDAIFVAITRDTGNGRNDAVQSRNKNLMVVGLLAFGIGMRVLPYVLQRMGIISLTDPSTFSWNISPVPAMCLLGGAYVSARWAGLGVGLVAYLISDLLIGWVSGHPAFSFYKTLPFVYAGFVLHGVIGTSLHGPAARGSISPFRIGATAIGAELAFFLLTNFGEWLIGDMNYAKTPAGLLSCYVAALPFLYRSLYGTLIYSAIFFELAAVLQRRFGNSQPVLAPVPRPEE